MCNMKTNYVCRMQSFLLALYWAKTFDQHSGGWGKKNEIHF